MKGQAPFFAIAAALLSGSLAAFYIRKVRPWMLNWGTGRDEARKRLPGDGHVSEPMLEATRFVMLRKLLLGIKARAAG